MHWVLAAAVESTRTYTVSILVEHNVKYPEKSFMHPASGSDVSGHLNHFFCDSFFPIKQ